MQKFSTSKRLLAAGALFAIVGLAPQAGFTAGDPPKCPKDKDCRSDTQGDDQTYNLGYWQAKSGAYEAALTTLRSAQDASAPRIQTMIGFSLRKLGRVDEAMQYYRNALAANPNLTTTRQYLGEAFLQIGQPRQAREQLAEIARRCGVACEDYRLLAEAIDKAAKAG